MSFLSSLFRNSGNEDEEEEEEFEPEMAPTQQPHLTKGMLLNVSLQSGPLLSGRLSDFDGSTLTIERAPGQFSFNTCALGATAYIKGYNNDSTCVDLKGMVDESTRVLFRVKDVQTIPHSEHRSEFRLPVSSDVTLYYQEDEHLQNPEACKLINISTGGACVQSEFIHGEGEVLRLKVQLQDYAPMVFLGEIIRVEEPQEGVFRYGFLFAKLDDKENASLTRMLFNLQVGNRKAWRRDKGSGQWG